MVTVDGYFGAIVCPVNSSQAWFNFVCCVEESMKTRRISKAGGQLLRLAIPCFQGLLVDGMLGML